VCVRERECVCVYVCVCVRTRGKYDSWSGGTNMSVYVGIYIYSHIFGGTQVTRLYCLILWPDCVCV